MPGAEQKLQEQMLTQVRAMMPEQTVQEVRLAHFESCGSGHAVLTVEIPQRGVVHSGAGSQCFFQDQNGLLCGRRVDILVYDNPSDAIVEQLSWVVRAFAGAIERQPLIFICTSLTQLGQLFERGAME